MLAAGVLAEFEKPKKLLESSTSLFAKLVAEYWSHAQQASDSGHDAEMLSSEHIDQSVAF